MLYCTLESCFFVSVSVSCVRSAWLLLLQLVHAARELLQRYKEKQDLSLTQHNIYRPCIYSKVQYHLLTYIITLAVEVSHTKKWPSSFHLMTPLALITVSQKVRIFIRLLSTS